MEVQADLKSSLSIGDLAARFGLATHVLRHWEDVGLLAPPRTAAGRRRYDGSHVVRVATILRAKQAGLALEDIRDLLEAPAGASRRAMLRAHREAVAERIAGLRAAERMLDAAARCEHADISGCEHFQRHLADLAGHLPR